MNKNLITIFVLAFISISFFYNQCYGQKNTTNVFLSGNIPVTNNSKVQLTNSPIFLGDDWHYNVDLTKLDFEVDKKGDFIAEILVRKPDFYRVTLNSRMIELFISPNDSIFIKKDSIIKVSGSNANLNQFFLNLSNHLNDNKISNLIEKEEGLFSLVPVEFLKKIDSLKQISLGFYNKFISENTLPELFKERCLVDINCCYKYLKLLYPIVLENIKGEIPELEQAYYDKIATGSLNHPNLMNSKFYMKFINTYIEFKSAKNLNVSNFYYTPREKIISRYNVITNLAIDNRIKNYLYEEHFKVCAINYSPKDWGEIYTKFKIDSKNKKLAETVGEKYNEALDLRNEPDVIKIYKKIDGIQLEAHIFYPKNYKKGDNLAAYAFFHGGGWGIGMPEWGYKSCKRYSEKGMFAVSFEYRLTDVHGTSIIECVEDAKSAIMWLRKNANELGVDPNKIVAEGFSAGGHLVAATALVEGYEDNTDFSSKPNALIMQSASYNFAKNRWFNGMTLGKSITVSPYQHLKGGMVPTIMFHSSNDYLVSINEFKEFVEKMKSLNNDFEYYIFEGAGHFFSDKKASEKVLKLKDEFLISRGFLDK